MTKSITIAEAWRISHTVAPPYHHNECSYNVSNGGLICDCDIVGKHGKIRISVPLTDEERNKRKRKKAAKKRRKGRQRLREVAENQATLEVDCPVPSCTATTGVHCGFDWGCMSGTFHERRRALGKNIADVYLTAAAEGGKMDS